MNSRLFYIKTLTNNEGTRYYKNIKYPPIPLSVDDIYIITTVGDRLDLLANQFYKDSELWWIISTANMDIIKRDSFALEAGLEIRIPANPSIIINNFKKLNKNNGGITY